MAQEFDYSVCDSVDATKINRTAYSDCFLLVLGTTLGRDLTCRYSERGQTCGCQSCVEIEIRRICLLILRMFTKSMNARSRFYCFFFVMMECRVQAENCACSDLRLFSLYTNKRTNERTSERRNELRENK